MSSTAQVGQVVQPFAPKRLNQSARDSFHLPNGLLAAIGQKMAQRLP
jgi:hypothetical protein